MRELIRQKIVDALAMPVPAFTRRTVRLPPFSSAPWRSPRIRNAAAW